MDFITKYLIMYMFSDSLLYTLGTHSWIAAGSLPLFVKTTLKKIQWTRLLTEINCYNEQLRWYNGRFEIDKLAHLLLQYYLLFQQSLWLLLQLTKSLSPWISFNDSITSLDSANSLIELINTLLLINPYLNLGIPRLSTGSF